MTFRDRGVKCDPTWVYFYYSDKIEFTRVDISNPDDFWGFVRACHACGWSIDFLNTKETALGVMVGEPWSEDISAADVFNRMWGVDA